MKTILIVCGIILGGALLLMVPAYLIQKYFPQDFMEIGFILYIIGIIVGGIGMVTILPTVK